MSIEGLKFYPGHTATPLQVVAMANEYRRAADTLLPTGRRGEPLSRAPYRLVAIHAVELYLNAFLLAAGRPAARVRGLHHEFGPRVRVALEVGLSLKQGTRDHLQSLSERREYLTCRYDPEASGLSELNRLDATLKDVARKVTSFVERSAAA